MKSLLGVLIFILGNTALAGGSEEPIYKITIPSTLSRPVSLVCKFNSNANRHELPDKIVLCMDKIFIFYKAGKIEISPVRSFLETRIWFGGDSSQWFDIDAPLSGTPIGLTGFRIRLQTSLDPKTSIVPVESLSDVTEGASIGWQGLNCRLQK